MTTRLDVSGGNLRARGIGKEFNWAQSCGFPHFEKMVWMKQSEQKSSRVGVFLKGGLN